MHTEKGNYSQVESLMLTLFNAFNCTRNAETHGLLGRFERMMQGIINIARLILRKKERAPGLPVMRYEALEL